MYSLSDVRVVTFIGRERGANEGGFPIVWMIIVLVALIEDAKLTIRYELLIFENMHGVTVLSDFTS